MSEPPAPETRAITLEVELPGTPEEVTRMLSDPAELARWFGTFWGAALGALASRWKPLPPGAGVALGILLWLSIDEGALPALGLSAKASAYPRQTHVRGLAGHVLYGVVLDRSLAVLRSALRR
jgi:uncharacterized membrane protein YagU involved in acid resistance